jgi:hypothetical protein
MCCHPVEGGPQRASERTKRSWIECHTSVLLREGDKSRLKDAFHCGVSLKGGFGSRASVSKTKDGCG